MSAPTIADPAATVRSASRRRPRSRLRPTPDAHATQEPVTAALLPDAPTAQPAAESSTAAGLSSATRPAPESPAAAGILSATRSVPESLTAAGILSATRSAPESAPAGGPSDAFAARAGRRRAGVPERPLTVTISIDGGGQEGRDRILAALRDLVEAAGDDSVVALRTPADRGHGVPGGGRAGVVNLDPKPRAAFRDGSVLDLSRLEYDLLLFFAENPRQVFSRAQLLERVWGHVHTGARTVDVHISRLRNKLNDHELITTVYGVGYRLADGAPVQVV